MRVSAEVPLSAAPYPDMQSAAMKPSVRLAVIGSRAKRGGFAMKAFARIVVSAALLCLGACSTQPWTMGKSPEAITLRWYEGDADLAAANRIAALHCRSWGKTAELTSNNRAGSAVFARFDCRVPPAPLSAASRPATAKAAALQSRRYG